MSNKDQNEMLPPWKQYPEINRSSIGWRMGDGEYYLGEWINYYTDLSKEEKEQYRRKYPQPIAWFGFYKMYASK